MAQEVENQLLPSPLPFDMLNLSDERQVALRHELADLFEISIDQVENVFPAKPFQEARYCVRFPSTWCFHATGGGLIHSKT